MQNDTVTFSGDTKAKVPTWVAIVDTARVTTKKVKIRSLLPLLAHSMVIPQSISRKHQHRHRPVLRIRVVFITKQWKRKTNNLEKKEVEAAITIVGEIVFDSNGFVVLAQGVDGKKLCAGTQSQWYPLQDGGDTVTFIMDIPTKTIGSTLQGANENQVRSRWMFTNDLLASTSHRRYIPNMYKSLPSLLRWKTICEYSLQT